MKKLYLFVTAILLLGMLTVGVSAAETIANGTCGDDLTWVLDDAGTLTISGTGAMTDYYVNEDKYTYMNPPWYSYAAQIEKIVVEEDVTSIGAYAFSHCQAVSVDLPDSLKVIQKYAFQDCSRLNSIVFPAKLEYLYEQFYKGCSSLKSITLPDNVICDWEIYSSIDLETIIVPASVTSIPSELLRELQCSEYIAEDDGEGYFSQDGVLFSYNQSDRTKWELVKYPTYSKVVSYTIPPKTISLGFWAFMEIYSLEELTIPESIVEIAENSVSCYDLKKVNFPNTMKSISSAFANSSPMKEVTFPNSLEVLAGYSFYACESLEKAYFKGAAPTIGEKVFGNASPIFTIYYIEGQSGWSTPTWNGFPAYPIAVSEETDYYTASLSTTNTHVLAGDTLYVNISTDNAFAAAEVTLKTSANLEYDEFRSTLNGAAVTVSESEIKLADYGTTQNSGIVYTLAFTVDNSTEAGDTVSVELKSAAFDKSANADANNLKEAALSQNKLALTAEAQRYVVTLPDIFNGTEEVAEGDDYTFRITADGKYYDYSEISATMGTSSAQVIDNGNGSYTIRNVTDTLVITGKRTPKTFTLTITYPNQEPSYTEKLEYGTDFIKRINSELYSIVSVKYSDGEDVSYGYQDNYLFIDGTDITDDISVILENMAAEASVIVTGNAASDAVYETFAVVGEAYTITVNKDSAYNYTVNAAVNDKEVTLSVSGNTYTISASDVVKGSIIFTINRTLIVENADAKPYLTVDGIHFYLVINETDKLEGRVYCYNDTPMYWSDKYNAYCILVAAESVPEISADDFKLIEGTTEEIDTTSGDINNSGKLDANDAQFVYNIYNGVYSEFTQSVTMKKFLSADVNGDGVINTQDAAAIINKILNIN